MGAKIVSPKAELTVLRGMTHKDKKIAGTLIASVDDSYFESAESKEIYAAIKNHMGKTGESPPFRILIEDPDVSKNAREYFRDSQATVTTIEEANKAVRVLNQYRKLRGVYQVALEIDTALQSDEKVDIERLLDKVSGQIAAARTSKQVAEDFLHFGKNNNSKDFVEDLLYGEDNDSVIPLGIEPFDRESGGAVRGSLVTLGASSGGGKSTVAGHIGKKMAMRGFKVVLVPLEMSKAEMTSRLIASESGIEVTRVLQKRLTDREKEKAYKRYKKWARQVKKVGGRLSVYKPKEDVSIEDVFAATASFDADVVIVDYISLLAGTDGDDSWRQLGAIARKAKINAEATNRVNILLCQVDEEGKIRYSRAISEHSTNSLIWNVKKEEREKPVGRVKIEQPKARNSRSFPFEIGIEWATMRVVPVESVSPDVGDVAEPMKNLSTDL
jgi:replicative DNA helicase